MYDAVAPCADTPIHQNGEGTVNGKSEKNIRIEGEIFVGQGLGQDQAVNAGHLPRDSDEVTNFKIESLLTGLGNITSVTINTFNIGSAMNNCGHNSNK